MSGAVHAIHGAGGYNPRNSLNVIINHVVPVANPDKNIFFELDDGSQPGTAKKVEGFVSTNLLPLWAGQQYIFASGGQESGNQFECMLTVNSGTAPTMAGSSATGVWITMGGGLFWGYERSTVGIESGSWTLQIRSKATAQVIASFGISPNLQVTP